MKILFSKIIILLAFLITYSFGDTVNDSCTPEETACKIFKEHIFKKLYMGDISIGFTLDENHRIINSFLDDYEKGLIDIYHERISSSYSKPYMDSLALFLAASEGAISQWEIDELKELHQCYRKYFASNNLRIATCDIEHFKSLDSINQAEEINRNYYFIKLNKHIRSNHIIYVQIEILNYYNEGFEVYIVLNGSDNSFLRYFINRF